MIKKTLCFSNPAYLSLRDAQLVHRKRVKAILTNLAKWVLCV